MTTRSAAATGSPTHSTVSASSCYPPTQTSSRLTVGTPDANGKGANAIGDVHFAVAPGNPTTPEDEADVGVKVSITDVRNRSDLSDYTGDLEVRSGTRITDKYNGSSSTDEATVQDFDDHLTLPCAATSSTTVGATCALATTFDAIVPNTIKETQRAIWQLGQVKIFDGGPDGSVATLGDNTLFMVQGVFVP
jgi:hypothetical protein